VSKSPKSTKFGDAAASLAAALYFACNAANQLTAAAAGAVRSGAVENGAKSERGLLRRGFKSSVRLARPGASQLVVANQQPSNVLVGLATIILLGCEALRQRVQLGNPIRHPTNASGVLRSFLRLQ
jgi:hypothetical protein